MPQIDRLKARLEGEDFSDALLKELLETAKDIIFEVRFPYSDFPYELEARYLGLQIQIAVELFNKLGAEGQQAHTENGISRTWSSADVSNDLLTRITPVIRVVKPNA